MKKNPFFWMLTAALVCGLSLTVTSCSDDDNDDNNNKPVSNETVIGGDITDDEIVLATILGNWCDFDASADLVHGIIDKTSSTRPVPSSPSSDSLSQRVCLCQRAVERNRHKRIDRN